MAKKNYIDPRSAIDPSKVGTPHPNQKVEKFCQLYALDPHIWGNATQCRRAAGYAYKSAGVEGHNLLKQPKVARRIRELQVAVRKATLYDADYIRRKLAAMVEVSPQDVIDEVFWYDEDRGRWCHDLSRVPRDVAEAIKTIGYDSNGNPKIEMYDKHKTIELLGKHIDVKAFEEKTVLDAGEGIAAMILRARANRAERAKEKEQGEEDSR